MYEHAHTAQYSCIPLPSHKNLAFFLNTFFFCFNLQLPFILCAQFIQQKDQWNQSAKFLSHQCTSVTGDTRFCITTTVKLFFSWACPQIYGTISVHKYAKKHQPLSRVQVLHDVQMHKPLHLRCSSTFLITRGGEYGNLLAYTAVIIVIVIKKK